MVGERASEREIFLWRGRAKNRLGELAIGFVPPCLNLRVQAAAAGLRMCRREHVLCIAARPPRLIERHVPGTPSGGPYEGSGIEERGSGVARWGAGIWE